MELKNKVVKGVFWSATERFGMLGLQTVISLLLTRWLAPGDFGAVAILTSFSVVANLIVDSGFAQALIRKQDANATDYASVFYLNIAIAFVGYLILVAITPLIALRYGAQMIAYGAVLFLTLPLNAIGLVQNTILTKEMNFKALTRISLTSSTTAGIIALILAFAGFGTWAIITQLVIYSLCRTSMLCYTRRWRPEARFSSPAIRALFRFSSRLFAADLLNNLYIGVTQLWIGGRYQTAELGLYSQAQKLRDMFVNTITGAVQNVTYPALSTLQDDPVKLRESYRKVLIVIAFLVFPAMAGLIAVAENMFDALLNPKWMPAVPYFRMLCLIGLMMPIISVNMNALKVKGRSNLFLRVEIISKTLFVVTLLATIRYGVAAIIWGQVICSFAALLIGMGFSGQQLGYRLDRQCLDLLPYLLLAITVWASASGINYIMDGFNVWAKLGIQILTGTSIYVCLALVCRVEAWRDVTTIVREILAKHK